jgi:hypothetical protein
VQAPIATAMITAPAATEPLNVLLSTGQILLSMTGSESAGHRPGCVDEDLDQLLGHRRGAESNLVSASSSRSPLRLHRGCLSGIAASGRIRLPVARVSQFPLAGRRVSCPSRRQIGRRRRAPSSAMTGSLGSGASGAIAHRHVKIRSGQRVLCGRTLRGSADTAGDLSGAEASLSMLRPRRHLRSIATVEPRPYAIGGTRA